LGVQQWRLPKVDHAQTIRVNLNLRGADGVALARNHVDLMVLPARARQAAFEGQLTIIGSSQITQTAAVNGIESHGDLGSEHSTSSATVTHGGGTPKVTPPSVRKFRHAVEELGYRTARRVLPETQV